MNNNKVNLDKKSLELIYQRNKPFIVPFVIVFVSILIIINMIVPQFQALQEALRVKEEASRKLVILQQELELVKSLDETELESQFKTLTNALPADKDFSGILNAIFYSVQKTGVNLGAFAFQVGGLDDLNDNEDKYPSIKLTVILSNDIKEANVFVDALSKTLPLSDISVVRAGSTTSSVDIMFYYKSVVGAIPKEGLSISPLSPEKVALINKVSEFNDSNAIDLEFNTTSSGRTTNPF